jgi:hypothetical protein
LVKRLLQILLGGFAVFMVLAMAREWQVFSSAWFGGEPAAVQTTEADRKAASDAVHQTLTLMEHLYTSKGDARFAERIPASRSVVDEILADIDYLARNHRRQEMDLRRLEIASVDALSEDALEIRTREYWNYRVIFLVGAQEPGPVSHQLTRGRYLVARSNKGWRVARWELDDSAADAGPDGP